MANLKPPNLGAAVQPLWETCDHPLIAPDFTRRLDHPRASYLPGMNPRTVAGPDLSQTRSLHRTFNQA